MGRRGCQSEAGVIRITVSMFLWVLDKTLTAGGWCLCEDTSGLQCFKFLSAGGGGRRGMGEGFNCGVLKDESWGCSSFFHPHPPPFFKPGPWKSPKGFIPVGALLEERTEGTERLPSGGRRPHADWLWTGFPFPVELQPTDASVMTLTTLLYSPYPLSFPHKERGVCRGLKSPCTVCGCLLSKIRSTNWLREMKSKSKWVNLSVCLLTVSWSVAWSSSPQGKSHGSVLNF